MAKIKSSSSQPTVNQYLGDLEAKLEKIFVGKAPALSDNVKEIIVKISPYLAVVSMVLLLPLLLGLFGISTFLMPFAALGGIHMSLTYLVYLVFSIAMIVLELMAIPGLFKRQESAWRLIFYSTLLSLVDQIFSFNLGGLIIGGAISLYFLFQVKSKYTK